MGLIYSEIQLSNPRDKNLKPMMVTALVDTGAMYTCIPEHIALQLELEEFEKREVTLADGKKQICSYMGPVLISFENRHSIAGVLVLGQKVLLGAIQMEDMDVVINPLRRKMTVNPDSPNIPSGIVM